MAPFSLATLLGKNAPFVDIIDIGAMQLGSVPPFYKPLMDAGLARVVGFEPQEAECAKLTAQGRKNHTYLPYFVGDGTERTFYLTKFNESSSLYEPNRELLDRFSMLGEYIEVASTSQVQTKRLDDIAEIASIDLLKIDVQGAELDVLRGAERKLGSVLVVEAEVAFVPMYKAQPLFAEVDQAMRAAGFMLHAFNPVQGRAYKPLQLKSNANASLRQVLWTDAIYVPTLDRWRTLSPERLLKLALILFEIYRSPDLAALAIQHHDAQTGKDIWKWYMQRLTGQSTVPAQPAL